jgi:ubiquinone/menaquinone biosynthesis C-methylase UbiE
LPDRIFSEQNLAELYDLFNPWGGRSGDDEFYMKYILDADSVLDVGCGTGLMLRKARELGHQGRLVGIDPAEAMLDVGRQDRSDIEWVHGDLLTANFDQEFELIIMTGHVFQVFLSDDDVLQMLTAVRRALTDTGRFIFETRNPKYRAWERWVPGNASEIAHPAGGVARMEYPKPPIVEGEFVTFAHYFTAPTFDGVEQSTSTLRFMDVDQLNAFLSEAELEIEAQYGFWDRTPVTDESMEIITIARRA